jgi:hypothetical protein
MRKVETKEGEIPGIVLPAIEFSSDKISIARGEAVLLRWAVKEAEEATMWESKVLPTAPEPLDWGRISHLGKPIKRADKLEVKPEKTTAYYLVAKTQRGLRGKRIVVEVKVKKKTSLKPFICSPSIKVYDKMESRPHIGWIGKPFKPAVDEVILAQIQAALKLAQQWNSPPLPPMINIVANPKVIFEDESCVFSWNVSNANSVRCSLNESADYLLADSSDPSGTKHDGGGIGHGDWLPCTDPACMSSTWTIGGPALKQRNSWFHVWADNVLGGSATAGQWTDILSIPNFTGNYTTPYSGFSSRQAWIRDTLKKIDEKLRNGCILSDVSLDQTVDAFKQGYLSRQEVWANLLCALQNMKLVTFKCENLLGTDQSVIDTPPASFQPYSNLLIFRWKPDLGLGPTEYAIMHELVHKCGFHNDLLMYYSGSDIEYQTDLVASACPLP